METLELGSGDISHQTNDIKNDKIVVPNKENCSPVLECSKYNADDFVVIKESKNNNHDISEPNKDGYSINSEDCSISTEGKNNCNDAPSVLNEEAKAEKLKPNIEERIAQCKIIIDSLKLEVNKEKNKLERRPAEIQHSMVPESHLKHFDTISSEFLEDQSCSCFNVNMDPKLCCDKNLIEYEKQLQRYKKTLDMAQNAKKNSIRKQMLAKAFKLKLLEVENQCNIELLRVKQNLQCLEPLKMIAESWKSEGANNTADFNEFELMLLYPEINEHFGCDTNYSNHQDL